MSNGDDDIIICGTGGEPVTDKTIVIYDAPFSVAIRIKKKELLQLAIAGGIDRETARRRLKWFTKMVEHDWSKWAYYLENDLCIEYTRHEPHAANFPDHG